METEMYKISAKPWIGRSVVFHENGMDRAAIITLVRSDRSVNLVVFNSKGDSYNVPSVTYGYNHNEWSETEGDRVRVL